MDIICRCEASNIALRCCSYTQGLLRGSVEAGGGRPARLRPPASSSSTLAPAQHSSQHRYHGQGQPHPADQQHALPGQDGAVAALQVDRGVSVHSVLLFQIYDTANGWELVGRSCPPSAQPPVNMCPHCPILILQIFIFV